MKTITYTCSECNKKIYDIGVFKNNTIYRCGDANVCSIYCSYVRLHKIINIDPQLDSPILWQDIPITSSNGYFKKVSSMENLEACNNKFNNNLTFIKEESVSSDDSIDYDAYYECDTIKKKILYLLMNTVFYFTEIISKIFYTN